mmetsp:Transcript_73584/g.225061  ORF Transcript_73584/g.225061 Transcript_73584/m.225061 type:complete len:95 (+) Transcript_73584:2277-2561(+)
MKPVEAQISDVPGGDHRHHGRVLQSLTSHASTDGMSEMSTVSAGESMMKRDPGREEKDHRLGDEGARLTPTLSEVHQAAEASDALLASFPLPHM